MAVKGRRLKNNNEKMNVLENCKKHTKDEESGYDQEKLNEKHVSLYLFVEKNKLDPKETFLDEFKNKTIIYGYVMVNCINYT